MDFLKKIGQFLLNPFGNKKEPEKPSHQSGGRSDRSRDGGRYRPRNSRGGQRSSSRPDGNPRSGGRQRGGRNRFQSRDGNRPQSGNGSGGRDRSRRHSGRPQGRNRPQNSQRERGMNLKDSRNEQLTGEKRTTGVPKEELIGTVTHFFAQVNAAAIKLDSGGISMGDTIAFKGPETAFRMKIESLQIDRVPVPSAPRGSEVGILVRGKVKEGDRVYRVL